MTISKNTIDEMLETYLGYLGLDERNINEIKRKLHKGVKIRKKEQAKKQKEEEKEERVREKKYRTKVSHGTSCPRITNKYGELIVEM